ncbi:MAG: filamentous hemagglutinin N-terminal domain-containing protein [Pseudomonadota bacterium]
MIPMPRLFRALLLSSTGLAALPAGAQTPNARPTGGSVTAGTASIAQTDARTTVTQGSNRAIIDWRGFDVGRDHTVRFDQPGASALTLNRIGSGEPSRIAGGISANGGVLIINQAGVVFTGTARVDAASVIVSTADTANERFMAGGRMVFDRPGRADARILNEGSITARQAGIAALVAPEVVNRGTISARLGSVILAGAETHTLDLHGDGLFAFDVTGAVRRAPSGGGALVTNTGVIEAEGGRVLLTARAADGVVTELVRAGGRISANTDAATGRRGDVVISGTGGAVVIEGVVEARGVAAGTRGGVIEAVADRGVVALPGARINASGAAGGGEIAFGQTRIGSAAPQRAARTGVAAGAELRADATVLGQGGTIIIHSTEATVMAGAVSARGGPQGGDGGFVEVSGERGFRVPGSIDVGAPLGQPGTVLFDPDQLVITDNGFTLTGVPDFDPAGDSFLFGETPVNAFVTPAQVAAVTGDLLLQATSSLRVESATTKPQGSLTLQTAANGNIQISANLIVQTGNLTLIGTTINFGALAQAGGTVTLQNAGGTAPANVTTGPAGRVVASNLTQTGALAFQSIGLGGDNVIGTIGDLTTVNAITIRNLGSLAVSGTVARNSPTSDATIAIEVIGGDLTVNGRVNAAPVVNGNFILEATGSINIGAGAVLTGGIPDGGANVIRAATPDGAGVADTTLPGGVTLAGAVTAPNLRLEAGQAGIVQTAGSVTANSLVFLSGGAVRLDRGGSVTGTRNAVAQLAGTFPSGARDLVLDNGTTDLLIGTTITAANIRLATEGTLTLSPPPLLTVGTGGVLSAPTGTIALAVNGLSMPPGALTGGTRVDAATVEIAPATARPMQFALPDLATPTPGTLALNLQTLSLISATDTLRIGGTTFGTGSATTASAITLAGPFTRTGTLDLRTTGDITQAAGGSLTLLGTLTGIAGGAVTLTEPGNTLNALGDFASGGNFLLTVDGGLNITGLLSAPGRIVVLDADGAITESGAGRITAAELRLTTGDGVADLQGANLLDRLGETAIGGDLTLVNTGGLMTIPGGALVTANGAAQIRATAGSITVDGTVRAPGVTLSAPVGTVAVNGFSAIATSGVLLLTGNAVAVNGLVSSPVQVTVQGTTSASMAGFATTPLLVVSAPSVTFGGLSASGLTRLSLGSSGFASGVIATRQLAVLGGRGTLLTGNINFVTGESAAALGERRNAQGVTEPSPPPNALDYLFNNCAIAVPGLCAPPPPVVVQTPQDFLATFPRYTVADNPRGLQRELDPAGQPAGLVRLPTVPLVLRPGRDAAEDRELAPPNVRAEDF